MHAKLMTLVLVLAAVALGTSALAQDPIAHYPLLGSAADATGNHGDFVLENCPYDFGGVYVDGSWFDTTCQTPVMSDLSWDQFTVIVDFKITGYHDNLMPVVWVGRSWRTLGFEISIDGYAGITTGSGDSNFVQSDAIVTLGEWHTARLSWNVDMGFGSAYLDGELIMLAERDPVNPSADKRVIAGNGSLGRMFEGIWGNLYVYNTDDPDPVATDDMTWGGVKSLFR